MTKFYDYRLPNIADLAKAITWARKIYKQNGNYGRVYIDYETGGIIREEFTSPDWRLTGLFYSVDIWRENRAYNCASMSIHHCKTWLVHRFG